MSFSPAVHSSGGETETTPALPSVTLTYVKLGHMDGTGTSVVCRSLLEGDVARRGRTKIRITKDFVILETAFPATSVTVRLIDGKL